METEFEKEKHGIAGKGHPPAAGPEYLDCVRDILRSPEVRRMNQYMRTEHHLSAALSERFIQKLPHLRKTGIELSICGQAGLLHDLFLYVGTTIMM